MTADPAHVRAPRSGCLLTFSDMLLLPIAVDARGRADALMLPAAPPHTAVASAPTLMRSLGMHGWHVLWLAPVRR